MTPLARRLLLCVFLVAGLAAPSSVVAEEPVSGYKPLARAALVGVPFDPPDVEISAGPREQAVGRLDSTLSAVARKAVDTPKAALKQATAAGLEVEAGRIQVEITVAGSSAEARAAVNNAGGEVTGSGDDGQVLQAFVAPGALAGLSRAVNIAHVAAPTTLHAVSGDYMTEGDAALGGPSWRSSGATGANVKVGIIDLGFLWYTDLLGYELPASVTAANFVDFEEDWEVDGTTEHGTACAEVIHDIAPDAELYLAKVQTLLDVEEAADWLVGQGVDIISMSLGAQNTGPGDGTGWFNNVISNARSAGVTWFIAAGNERQQHWGGASNLDADGLQKFGTGNVNWLGPDSSTFYYIPSGYYYTVEVRWNDWVNVDQDFDILMVRYNGSSWEFLADYGMQDGGFDEQWGGFGQTPTETAYGFTFGADTFYGFVVAEYDATHAVNFEMFGDLDLGIRTTSRSIANTADAASAVTVGAVNVSGYAQEPYSGEGPTNGPGGSATGGSIKPDLAAYANVDTWSYGDNAFNGTSAATPHAAGAAALVLDANPAYTPDQLETYLTGQALDLGVAGLDNKFGAGRVRLGGAPSGDAPGNDNFAQATTLDGEEGALTGTNAGATAESGEVANTASSTPINSVWYGWIAPSSGSASFDTCGSGFDTTIGVYTGSSVSGLTQLAANDDDPLDACGLDSRITLFVSAGQTYRIAVDGYGAATGSVVLNYSSAVSDVAPPSVTGATGVIKAPQTLGTAMAVLLSWDPASDPSGIASYQLQSKKGTKAWQAVALSSPTATSASVTLTVGATYRFRLRATDGAGNTSGWVTTNTAKLRVIQENATSILYTGTWKRVALSGASGGYVKYATGAGTKARLSFTGAAAAFVATVAPGRGIAEVWIDGVFVTTLDTYNSTLAKKRVVFATPRLALGAHTLEIRVTGTKRPASSSVRIDIDAFLAWP